VSAKARFFTYPPIAGDLTIRDVTREVESRGVDRFLMGETQPPGPPKRRRTEHRGSALDSRP